MKTSTVRRRLGAILVGATAAFAAAVAPALVAPSAQAATGVVSPLPSRTYSLSSYYGPRCMPVTGASTWHLGQDMGAGRGVRVNAVADGTVLRAGAISGFGQWVVIRHTIGGRTMSSLYAHVIDGDRYVRAGQKVRAGQRIADVGSSGTATGPHLHLEMFNGAYGSGASNVDPLAYLRGRGLDLAKGATRVATRSVPSSCTYYATAKVNLRSGPSTGHAVRTVVPRGGKFTAKPGASSGSWRQVTYGSLTGWVTASSVTPRKPAGATPVSYTPSTPAPAGKSSYVTASSLNLRSGPSTSSSVLARLAKGTKVTHLAAASKGWIKVKAGSRTGYVSTSYLSAKKPATTKVTPPAKATPAPAKVSYVNVSSLNLRSKASTSSTVVTKLAKGTKVTHLAAASKGWVKVKAGSRTGYVSTSYLSAKKPATTKTTPAKATPAPAKVSYVNVTSLNLRSKASTSSAVVTKLAKGTKVTHLAAASKGWVKVKAGSKTGYLSTSYLSAKKPATTKTATAKTTPAKATPAPAEVSYVTVSSLNLRSKASTSSSVVTKLTKGTKVTHLAKVSNGWVKVKAGSKTGYVSTSYLSSTKPR